MTPKSNGRHPASFRDSSGHIYVCDNELYRQINLSYKDHYNYLMSSGLYAELTRLKLLVKHAECDLQQTSSDADQAFKIIKPDPIDFISYPYEWCFSQIKDAALLTLRIQEIALAHGMTLKDSSAYNVQFVNGKPIFIDTLSFEIHDAAEPWKAYRQFCQHFVAPLALMSLKDHRLSQLLKIYIDGIPLDLASALLPRIARLKPSLLTHLYFQVMAQSFANRSKKGVSTKKFKYSLNAMRGLVDSLKNAVVGLSLKKSLQTEWGAYYSDTNYSKEAFDDKKNEVSRLIGLAQPTTVWDIGANTGEFSRLAHQDNRLIVSMDVDMVAVEQNYASCVKDEIRSTLPLVMDLSNPSPSMGWSSEERESLLRRGPADLVMALAIVHHMVISLGCSMEVMAQFFHSIGSSLIIEFVPIEDSQVQRLLVSRDGVLDGYDLANFEKAMSRYFTIGEKTLVKDSKRTLYLMNKKQ